MCASPLTLKFSKSNIQNRIHQENEKLLLKTINIPDLELQKVTSHKTILVKALIFFLLKLVDTIHTVKFISLSKPSIVTIFSSVLILYLISGTSLSGFLSQPQNIPCTGPNYLWAGNKQFLDSVTTKVSIRPSAKLKMSPEFFPTICYSILMTPFPPLLNYFHSAFGNFFFNGDCLKNLLKVGHHCP